MYFNRRFISNLGFRCNLINICKGFITHKSYNYNAKAFKSMAVQNFDYFLVLDFESSCDSPIQLKPMEVIEFPVLKVNARNFNTENIFHHYVQPKHHKTLTSFCTELTGIIQDMVDSSHQFEHVFHLFNEWLQETGLVSRETKMPLKRFAFVTCGNWDLQIMLPDQCLLYNIRIPLYMKQWINIKKSYADATGQWPKSMSEMIKSLDITPIGRLHSGIDDCKNIAAILKLLAEKHSFTFKITNSEW